MTRLRGYRTGPCGSVLSTEYKTWCAGCPREGNTSILLLCYLGPQARILG